MQVLNISRRGALLESEVRLPPRMRTFLKIVTANGVIQMAASVLRSAISGLKGVPRYQSAVVFEKLLPIPDEGCAEVAGCTPAATPESASSAPVQTSASQQESQPVLAGNMSESAALLKVTAKAIRSGSDQLDLSGLNDW